MVKKGALIYLGLRWGVLTLVLTKNSLA